MDFPNAAVSFRICHSFSIAPLAAARVKLNMKININIIEMATKVAGAAEKQRRKK